jgi:rhamnose transport system permease protein
VLKRVRLETSAASAILALSLVLLVWAPGFFEAGNLVDVLMANLPVLLVALGATVVIIAGEIDISVGSVFAVCSVVSGALAAAGVPVVIAALAAPALGVVLGAATGTLVAYLRIPSIVATLAAMVVLRDLLRWVTQGEWIQGLPADFQWLGLGQSRYPLLASLIAVAVTLGLGWSLRSLQGGRAVYAVGSHAGAAMLFGIDVARTRLAVFALAGGLTGLAALVNTVRFSQIPINTGLGLEMRVIAAVVVGGAAIRGGRGTVIGTCLGVVLLGMSGPALTFLGVHASWERALQGAIILAAVSVEILRPRAEATRSVVSMDREPPRVSA